jgi:hypothetical protein
MKRSEMSSASKLKADAISLHYNFDPETIHELTLAQKNESAVVLGSLRLFGESVIAAWF